MQLEKVTRRRLSISTCEHVPCIGLRVCWLSDSMDDADFTGFPYINCDVKRQAYAAQKAAYMKAASTFDCPIEDISIPHTAGTAKDEGKEIPLYVRVPKGASKQKPAPAVILMCGLDGHRPDNTVRSNEFLARGWASVIVSDCG